MAGSLVPAPADPLAQRKKPLFDRLLWDSNIGWVKNPGPASGPEGLRPGGRIWLWATREGPFSMFHWCASLLEHWSNGVLQDIKFQTENLKVSGFRNDRPEHWNLNTETLVLVEIMIDIDPFMLLEEEEYQDGDVILREGTSTDWIYVILEGQVRIQKSTPKGAVAITTIGEGQILGEMAFLEMGKVPLLLPAM